MQHRGQQDSKDLIVMGIDILPGSSPSKSQPYYAVVLLKNGNLYAKSEETPLNRLIRLVWEYRPHILAIDNIYELGSNEREVIRILSLLPDNLKVVQVTRWQGKDLPLREVAIQAGINVEQQKLTPLKTAYLAALLAYKGYGSPIRLVEEKTRIIVSKTSSSGKGGMSSSRYKRKIRASILHAVREIKSALDRAGIDYDLLYRKSGGGLDSALFIVYAPRHELYGIVKPWRGADIRIQVKPVYKSRIEFEDTERTEGVKRYLIVGYDPGVTAALACISLDSSPVLVISGKNIDRAEAITMVLRKGIPVLVATDKHPPPESVKKLAASLNVPVYSPQYSLSVKEKQELVLKYKAIYNNLEIPDSHVRDALAAALKAYEDISTKLHQVERYLSKLELELPVDKIKAMVIAGKSIAQAVEEEITNLLVSEEQQYTTIETASHLQATDSITLQEIQEKERRLREKYEEEIKKLKAERRVLKKLVDELREEIARIEKEKQILLREWNKEIATDRRVELLQEEVRTLSSKLKDLYAEHESITAKIREYSERIRDLILGRYVLALKIHSLLKPVVERVVKEGLLVKKPPVFVENPGAWDMDAIGILAKNNVPYIVVNSESIEEYKDAMLEHLVPILSITECAKHDLFDFVLLPVECEKLAESRRRDLEEERRRTKEINLEDLLEEYRAERKKELGLSRGYSED